MSAGQPTSEDDGDVETVRCCPDPECRSARISLHTSSAARARHQDTARWRCTECGNEFDEPDTRPSRAIYRGPTSPPALALRDADPDDVLPDGGVMEVRSLGDVSCPRCLFDDGTAAFGKNMCRECGEWFKVTRDRRVHPAASPRHDRARRAAVEGGRS